MTWYSASPDSMRNLLIIGNPSYQHASEVSIVTLALALLVRAHIRIALRGLGLILSPIGQFCLEKLQPSSVIVLFRFCSQQRNSFLLGPDGPFKLARLGKRGS